MRWNKCRVRIAHLISSDTSKCWSFCQFYQS